MSTTQSMTADELLRLPEHADGTRFELVQGELVMMSPAGGRHGKCCLTIGRVIGNYVDAHSLGNLTSNDTGIVLQHDPDTVLAPDVAFWTRERLPEVPEGFVEVPPDLAIEVVSPNDPHARLHEKVLCYLDHGVKLVWVADPEAKTVTVYRSRQDVQILGAEDTISGEVVLPGFSCGVAEFFE
jgi:Uma2 family endonuclease